MFIKGFCLSLILLLLGYNTSYSQEQHTEICVDFRVNSKHIDPLYGNNATRMENMVTFLREIRQDSNIQIVNISFNGAASPEGSYQVNHRLSRARLEALEKVVRTEVEIPDSIITRNDDYIPWSYLRTEIAHSDLAQKQQVLDILDEDEKLVGYHNGAQIDHRIPRLKALDNGRVWQEIFRRYFAQMRNACVVVITYKKEVLPVSAPTPEPKPEPEPEPVVTPEPEPAPVIVTESEVWTRQLHVKTNAIGLAMAIANVAVEVDLAPHWSFTLPVYFSAWDYFKSTLKFRTFCVQPEVRYWLDDNNEGWFAGAHFGAAFFNYALNGDYRYQDHGRDTPALGGGAAVGYRTYLSKNKRWKLEFALGGGAYSVNYDKFHNTKPSKDGLMLESSVKKTYWGIDQASISIAYTLDLKKKGGKR